jgi:hypothetical protein
MPFEFKQTNNNIGDVNNAISQQGNVVQTTGSGNKVRVENPKKSFWGMLWEKLKALVGLSK